ncbi:hypothetical protein [Tenacibaculum soleae]|uniref:hypothetical protein n=1 Tax=Tenacibaculum soleae TaxID=447689 RepID=UPI0026E33EC0|nr:hypothetical protein [Tenacibaculum soleae]MDO6813235.1 hypothetical protein [Tenacibaculum soleae]
MAISKKHKGKIDNSNLNDWLTSLGFLYPIIDLHLDRFDKLFEDYPYKLSNATIDAKAIINGTYKSETKILSFKKFDLDNDIGELKMVARKGQSGLPQHIIDKMIAKHKKKPNND